jgi:hypothetical protein
MTGLHLILGQVVSLLFNGASQECHLVRQGGHLVRQSRRIIVVVQRAAAVGVQVGLASSLA